MSLAVFAVTSPRVHDFLLPRAEILKALLLVATVALYFKGRWKEKRGKSLDPKSMVPLVEGESKETDSVYSYEDKDTKV